MKIKKWARVPLTGTILLVLYAFYEWSAYNIKEMADGRADDALELVSGLSWMFILFVIAALCGMKAIDFFVDEGFDKIKCWFENTFTEDDEDE